MYKTLLSNRRRTLRLSSALVGVALLAACENDRPLGPNAASGPTTPSLSKGKVGTLVITIADKQNMPPTTLGAQFTVAKSGGPTYIGVDNGPGDGNPTIGVIQMSLAAGSYTVCQTVAPTDYVMPSQACQPATLGAGSVVQVNFLNLMMARATFRVIDYASNYIGGAELALRDTTGAFIAKFTDNSPPDLDPNPGRVELKFAVEGLYSFCWMSPPAGYVFPYSPPGSCVGFHVTHGEYTQGADVWVFPPFSAYWHVTDGTAQPDGFATLVGPSTFQVTDASGAFSTIITDNGPNDFDTRLGRLAIKLPADGQYDICQTVAAPKTNLANPPCKRAEVKYAVPAWMEFFFNYPL